MFQNYNTVMTFFLKWYLNVAKKEEKVMNIGENWHNIFEKFEKYGHKSRVYFKFLVQKNVVSNYSLFSCVFCWQIKKYSKWKSWEHCNMA